MNTESIRAQLKEKGLKVTPQRVAIFEAVTTLKNHPTADNINDYIKKNHPNISVGTVYKVLDSLVAHGLLNKVKSEKDLMRYDAIVYAHHHMYSLESDQIADYEDPELDQLLKDYFEKKKIEGFKIKDITLQISGKFTNQ